MPARCSLHVVYPPELRQSFQLEAIPVVLGRSPEVGGCVLEHGTVSRRHAVVVWSSDRNTHLISDLGSRNGSAVDQIPVSGAARALADGSVVRLGDTLLIYEQDTTGIEADAGGAVDANAIPGNAVAMRTLRGQVARAAADPAPVLIIGETGTGKEWIARELHRLSGRSGRLVTLNCAALSPHIVESQLFGHAKGAFTGATEAQIGLFRAAQSGTLFLDEIGELAAELQPKLLRALQEGEVLPVGSMQPVRVDVRVIAATHRDLASASSAGGFRQDLYARLSLWELRVPPLRARRVDLLDWIDRLHRHWAAKRSVQSAPLSFDVEAAAALLGFAWPLNLRGLDRLVHELGSSFGNVRPIKRAQLPPWLGAARPATEEPPPAPPPDARASTGSGTRERIAIPTREEFTAAYQELGGSVHALSRRFGRDRRQIYRWAESYGLRQRQDPGAD